MITSSPVLIILLFLVCLCKSEDQLTPANPLFPGDKLISNGGVFALGFFSPDSSNKGLYVGIWYNNIPVSTYVWVANRDNPITTNSSGKLVVTNSSDLVVLDSTSRVLWTTKNNLTAGGVGAAAILLNSGKLVIQLPNGTDIWQSSDHPTDTILPDMRFWLSKKDRIAEHLVAWKGPDDPSTGNFSMGGDSDLQVFIWNGTTPYWRKAAWVGAMVSGMFQTNSNLVMFQKKVTGGGNFYTIYTVSDGSPSVRMTLDHNGMVRYLAWNNGSSSWSVFLESPRTDCDRYGSCGPFGFCDSTETAPKCKCLDGFEPDGVNFSIGCQRREELICGTCLV